MRTAEEVAAQLGITPDTVGTRLSAVGFGPLDQAALAQAAPHAAVVRDAFLDELYTCLRANADTAALLATDAQVARLKALQHAYLADVFESELNWPYALRRLWIGVVHHRVRLSPQWYVATYAHVVSGHVPTLFATAAGPEQAMDQTVALVKAVLFEASLVLDAYGRVDEESLWTRQDQPEAKVEAEATSPPDGAARAESFSASYSRLRLERDAPGARRAFLGLDTETLTLVRAWAPIIDRRMPDVLEEFYEFLQREPAVAPLVAGPVAIRLKRQLAAYWSQVASGEYDQAHASSRMRVGVIHERHGVDSAWYLATFARQLVGVLRGLDPSHPDAASMVGALVKAVFFDLSFVIDAYMDARADRLLQVEGFVQQLVSGMESAVAIVDVRNRLVSANRSLVQLAGGDAAVLYLLPLDRALPIHEAAPLVDALRRQVSEGGSTRLSGRGRIGARRLRLTAVALGAGDALDGTVALVVDDVTALLRAAEDMEDQRGHVARVANDVGVVVWDMDRSNWTITAVNAAALDVTGWADVDFLGRPSAWVERVDPQDRDLVIARLSALTPGVLDEVDYRWQRPNGDTRWLRTRTRVAAGQAVNVLQGVTVDITEAKRRDQLRLDALASTAGGVAHVVNNCLTAVIGSLEMLDIGQRSHMAHALIREALQATEKATLMASHLVAFSGRQMLRPEVLSLNSVVRAASWDINGAPGGAPVVQDLQPDLWGCRVDPRLFGAAVEALVANARQAVAGGGAIRVSTRNVSWQAQPGDAEAHGHDWVECAVSDTGVGMTDDVRRHAFDPFFTTHSLADSSGLGLSMVHGFVTQSGGHVRLESRPGLGTTVRIRLPRYAPSEGARPPGPLVLVVEDDQSVRLVAVAMLRTLGYRVAEASAAAEARRLFDEAAPDIVIADIVLGHGDDGVQLVLEFLRTRPAVSILLMSGFAKTSFDLSNVPSGVGFLPKPFSLTALRDSLVRVASSRTRTNTDS